VRDSCKLKPLWYPKDKDGNSYGYFKLSAHPPKLALDSCGDPQMTLFVGPEHIGNDSEALPEEYIIEVGNNSTEFCPRDGFKYTLQVRDLFTEEDVTYEDPSCKELPQKVVVKGEGTVDGRCAYPRPDDDHCWDWEGMPYDFSFSARNVDNLQPYGRLLYQKSEFRSNKFKAPFNSIEWVFINNAVRTEYQV